MILTDLQTYTQPWLNGREFKRRYRLAKKQTAKALKSNTRKAKTAYRVWLTRQYFLSAAASDLRVAARKNEDILITSLIAAYVLGFCFAATSLEFLILFLKTAYDAAELFGVNMSLLIMEAGAIFVVMSAWLLAFVLNMVSVSVMDGTATNKLRSVRRTARRSLRYASRVAGAWIAFAILLALPLGIAAIAGYWYIRIFSVPMTQAFTLVPKLAVLPVAWIVFVLMHYSLAPYVALFETKLGLKEIFARSRKLVKNRGRLFLLGGYALLGSTMLAVYKVAEVIERVMGLSQAITFSAGALTAILAANGIMVMFYRKRKLARK